jgi:hypothetical protein
MRINRSAFTISYSQICLIIFGHLVDLSKEGVIFDTIVLGTAVHVNSFVAANCRPTVTGLSESHAYRFIYRAYMGAKFALQIVCITLTGGYNLFTQVTILKIFFTI